jgi:WhiB family transcriptional regulator, redox-sensing transcriptional regulator
MAVIRTVGRPAPSASISPAALVLVQLIVSAAQPWSGRALCAQTDPHIFFCDGTSETAQAKAICRRCEVRAECLSYALQAGEAFGVWGGHDPDERRRLLRQRRSGRPSLGTGTA